MEGELLMAGFRFWLQSSLSAVLILVLTQAVKAQEVPPVIFTGPLTQSVSSIEWARIYASVENGPTCKVYSLAELDDPGLCKWIAETIPEMIQPATWKQNGAKVSYYAPSKVLVVNNTMAVHNQIE